MKQCFLLRCPGVSLGICALWQLQSVCVDSIKNVSQRLMGDMSAHQLVVLLGEVSKVRPCQMK